MVAELEQDTQKTNILGQNVPEKFDWQKKQREMYEEKKQKQEQEDIITGKNVKETILNNIFTSNPSNPYQSGINPDTTLNVITSPNVSKTLNVYPDLKDLYVTNSGEIHAKTRRGGETLNLGLYTPDVDITGLDIMKFDGNQLANIYGMEQEINQIAQENDLGFEQAKKLYFENSRNKFEHFKTVDEKVEAFNFYSGQANNYRAYALSQEGFSPDDKGGYLYQPGSFRSTWLGDAFTQGIYNTQKLVPQAIDLVRGFKYWTEVAGGRVADEAFLLSQKGISKLKGETEEEYAVRKERNLKAIQQAKDKFRGRGVDLSEQLFPSVGETSLILGTVGIRALDYLEDISSDGLVGVIPVDPKKVKKFTRNFRIGAEPVNFAGTIGATVPEYLAIGKTITKTFVEGGKKLIKQDKLVRKQIKKEIKEDIKRHRKGEVDYFGTRLIKPELKPKLTWKGRRIKNIEEMAIASAKDPKKAYKLDAYISGTMATAHGIGTDVVGLEAGGLGDFAFQLASGILVADPKRWGPRATELLKKHADKAGKGKLFTKEKVDPAELRQLKRDERLSKAIVKEADKSAAKYERLTVRAQEEYALATKMVEDRLERLQKVFPKWKEIRPTIGQVTQIDGVKALEASNLKGEVSLMGQSQKELAGEGELILHDFRLKNQEINKALWKLRQKISKSDNPDLANDLLDKLHDIKGKLNIKRHKVHQKYDDMDIAINKIGTKGATADDFKSLVDSIDDVKLGLKKLKMEKDIADLDPLEKIAKTSAERVKKIEAIESLIDGAYIKQRFFDPDTYLTRPSTEFTNKVHKTIDNTYKAISDKFSVFYNNQKQKIDISELYDAILPELKALDPRVEWFKGGKKVIRNKISVYLNGEKNASINEFIENRLKGENAGKFIDDLKQIIKDYKLEGFDSFLKSKEPIEVLKKTYKQDINIAVNKGYDEGRFNIPIKTSVQDLHSSLSALLAATRKGTTEEATRVYKPLIDLYGKHFLDNEEIGGSVKLVNDLYKTEKVAGWYRGTGQHAIKTENGGIKALSGDQIINKYIEPGKGKFENATRDFNLMFPEKVSVITKNGPVMKNNMPDLVKNDFRIHAINDLREGWLRNMAGKDESFFTAESLTKYKNTDLWTTKGGGLGYTILDDGGNMFIDAPINYATKRKDIIAQARNIKLGHIKEMQTVGKNVNVAINELIKKNPKYANTVLGELTKGADSARFVEILTGTEGRGGSVYNAEQLVNAVKNSKLPNKAKILEDIRVVYMDGVLQKTATVKKGVGAPDAEALEFIVKKNRNVTKALGFDKEHMQALDDIAEFAIMFSKDAQTIRGILGMPKGLTLEGILSRMYAVVRGVVSVRFILSEALLRIVKLRNYGLMKEAVRDKRSAQAFVDLVLRGEKLSPDKLSGIKRLFARLAAHFEGTQEYGDAMKDINTDQHLRIMSKEEIQERNLKEFGDADGAEISNELERLGIE